MRLRQHQLPDLDELLMPYAKRVDANHGQIRDALRRLGYFVADMSRSGRGFPDLLIAKAGRMRLVEVKDGSRVPSERLLNPEQAKLHAALLAAGCPVVVVTSLEEAEQL